MKDIKKMAAKEFCCSSAIHQVLDFYRNVREVAEQARESYADSATAMDDGEFSAMLFFDGCFLLQFMTMVALDRGPQKLWTMPQLSENWMQRISRDILLVENQIPWVVLEALMRLKHVLVDRYIADTISNFDVKGAKPHRRWTARDPTSTSHSTSLTLFGFGTARSAPSGGEWWPSPTRPRGGS